MEMTGGEAVVAALETLGVRHVFGIVSVHNLPIYDAIARRGTITPIGVRHEQAAAHAADGYARATGELGVVIASTGPGTTNTMTGLFEASFASSPVLLVTGQIDSSYLGKAKGFLHEAEHQRLMLSSLCRRVETVRRTEDIGRAIIAVAEDIRAGRPQPGAVEIPIDQQYRRAEVMVPGLRTDTAYVPDADALAKVAEALSAATRPVLWAGGGVVSSGAGPALVALAERLGAPVVTTVEGRGSIPEDHPLCLGALTTSPPVEDIVSSADMVLAVGTRFQGNSTRNWSLSFGGTLAHLDADPAVIGRNYPTALPVVGDARIGLELPARRDRPGQYRPRACGEGPVGGCGGAQGRPRLARRGPRPDHGRHPAPCSARVGHRQGRDRPGLPVGRPAAADPSAPDLDPPGLRGDRPRPAAGAGRGGGQRAPGRADRRRRRVHAARRRAGHGGAARPARGDLPVQRPGLRRAARHPGPDVRGPDYRRRPHHAGLPGAGGVDGRAGGRGGSPAEFESRFSEAIASGRPTLLDIDLLKPSARSACRARARPGARSHRRSAKACSATAG